MVLEATIGAQLKLAREARGIPLREISDQTRISIHYLEAIETNDYQRLPGGIFNRSFVKAYARYVGFDEKEAIEAYTRYMRDLGDGGEEVASTPYHSKVYTDAPATRSPILTVVLAIVILAVLTGVALAILSLVKRRAAELHHADSSLLVVRIECEPKTLIESKAATGSSPIWKTDYEQFLQ